MRKLHARFKPKLPDIAHLLFFLILFFLPQQFGPHFWPAFSKVYGIRVDYLSPTLYISDILIILLFVFSYKNVFKNKSVKHFVSSKVFLFFLFVLSVPVIYASQPNALLFGMLKLFEFLYLGFYIVSSVTKKDLPTIIEIFTFTGVLESILAVSQFLRQGSIGSVLYFFGERTIYLSTLGAAVMNTNSGLILRPYGTFSHPNVLAFFLFMSVVFSSYGMHHAKGKRRYLLFAAVILTEAGLFLTFSRTIILVNIIFLLYAYGYVTLKESKKKLKNFLFVIFLIMFTAVYLFTFNTRFFNYNSILKDIIPRQDLIQISFSAIKTFPLFGTGLQNFYYYEGSQQQSFSSVYLQPVHNIFLFVTVSTGILGLFGFLYFLTRVTLTIIRKVKREKKIFSFPGVLLFLLFSIIFVGMFDHFFLTIQQGELMLTLILGLSFIKISS